VDCLVSPELVRIEVADQGPGFDPASVPDCTLEERLEVPTGRGVMLMRTFMTRLEYNATGNRVLMEKRRTPAEE
jgi:serine/threonine-protein kinase RsbW